jgi:hypothetical protein
MTCEPYSLGSRLGLPGIRARRRTEAPRSHASGYDAATGKPRSHASGHDALREHSARTYPSTTRYGNTTLARTRARRATLTRSPNHLRAHVHRFGNSAPLLGSPKRELREYASSHDMRTAFPRLAPRASRHPGTATNGNTTLTRPRDRRATGTPRSHAPEHDAPREHHAHTRPSTTRHGNAPLARPRARRVTGKPRSHAPGHDAPRLHARRTTSGPTCTVSGMAPLCLEARSTS